MTWHARTAYESAVARVAHRSEGERELSFGRVRVLVVDSDQEVASLVRRTFRDAEVAEVDEPHEALERLRYGESFDVILCDFVQPGMSGELFFDEIMWLSPAQARHIIFTGSAIPERARAFLSVVGQPFIQKPVDTHDLGARVRTLLDKD